MNSIRLESVGPIHQGEVVFGDLTVLVGPQATGKSIFLQMLKLIQDANAIKKNMKNYGQEWHSDPQKFFQLYFGEGMQDLWSSQSCLKVNDESVDLRELVSSRKKPSAESVFLIPAQRVMILSNGWPRFFRDFAIGDPYCVRAFSEHIRLLMEAGLGKGEGHLFPQERRLKKFLRDSIDTSIFNGASVDIEAGLQKRLVLRVGKGESTLPFMVWSAGQREFMPLLLGLYWLMPPTKTPRKKNIRWVIIEEPEMGLHPQAIFSFMLLILELVARGYRVVLSTHSPTVLDVVWAIRRLKDHPGGSLSLRQLFNFGQWYPGMEKMFTEVLRAKEFCTYYFKKTPAGIVVGDISSLDPGSQEEDVSGWGGLSGFSGHTADVVAAARNREGDPS